MNPADVTDDGPKERVWEFPRVAPGTDTGIQVFLEQAVWVPSETDSSTVRFTVGTTVVEHSQYRHGRITLRLGVPVNSQTGRSSSDRMAIVRGQQLPRGHLVDGHVRRTRPDSSASGVRRKAVVCRKTCYRVFTPSIFQEETC